MGQIVSCNSGLGCKIHKSESLFQAIREGDVDYVRQFTSLESELINSARCFSEYSTPLHCAASTGQFQIMSILLENGATIDSTNSHNQTPLMLACRNGHGSCTSALLQKQANILLFDKEFGRTCLHFAAKGGNSECVREVLSAARDNVISDSWGFFRFINVKDSKGATPLHLASRSGSLATVKLLLEAGALVSTSTTLTGAGPGTGSLPLHFAARGGSVEVVRELIAWGADRNQRDANGFTPHYIALKSGHSACAALLDPQSAEPLVWPSPWKFMSILEPQARKLLEAALNEANDARILKQEASKKDKPTRPHSVSKRIGFSVTKDEDFHSKEEVNEEEEEEEDMDEKSLHECNICFERACDIQVVSCGHRMCATCTLALCCHCKPNQAIPISPCPLCPFCRQQIDRLAAVTDFLVATDVPKFTTQV